MTTNPSSDLPDDPIDSDEDGPSSLEAPTDETIAELDDSIDDALADPAEDAVTIVDDSIPDQDPATDPHTPTELDDSIPDEAFDAAASHPFDDAASVRADDENPGTEPPPVPPHAAVGAGPTTAAGYRRLHRSRTDRKLGGVSAGIAQYFGIDPTLVRIAFAVLAITGVSILVYIACWILIPEHPADRQEPVWQAPAGTDRALAIAVGAGSLGVAIALLTDSWTLVAVALIAAGIWLLSDQPGPTRFGAGGGTDAHPDTWTPEPPPARVPVDAAARTATASWQPAPPLSHEPVYGQSASTPAAPVRRGPQRITRGVLSLLALLTAVGIAAATGDWWDVSATRFLGIAVVIIGVGVVLAALTDWGGRWLIPLGLLGLVLLLPVAAVDEVIDDGIGEVRFQPTLAGELLDEYHHGAGEMTVDLRGVDLDGIDRDIDIELGFGELIVLLPEDLGGTATVEADAGEISVDFSEARYDRRLDGVRIDSGTITLPGDRGNLDLDIQVGFGVVEVRTS